MSETVARPKGAVAAILVGGLIAATFDIVQVCAVYAVAKGVPPTRILQSVASGLLGPAAFKGGMPTALLGLGLHYFIALMMAATYVLAARRLEILIRRPWLMGTLYGLGLYAVMTYVVVPLSAAKHGGFNWLAFADNMFAHTLAVGVPIALAARWGLKISRDSE